MKLLKPVLANLRSAGVRLINRLPGRFLDHGQEKQEAEGAYMKMKSLLESLGFTVNAEKSLPIATQRIEFLGFIVDSVRMEISLPAQKMKNIRVECRPLLRDKVMTVRKLARLVGMLVATNLAILPAPFTTGPFRHCFQDINNTKNISTRSQSMCLSRPNTPSSQVKTWCMEGLANCLCHC